MAKSVPTTSLMSIMNEDADREEVDQSIDNQSLVKNKTKKISFTTSKSTASAKNKVKSTLKASFYDSHVQYFPQVLAEASVTLKSETPIQEFIVSLQELFKNSQLVEKKMPSAQ
jgi:hypothetical protein